MVLNRDKISSSDLNKAAIALKFINLVHPQLLPKAIDEILLEFVSRPVSKNNKNILGIKINISLMKIFMSNSERKGAIGIGAIHKGCPHFFSDFRSPLPLSAPVHFWLTPPTPPVHADTYRNCS